jgi:hypothetical protein
MAVMMPREKWTDERLDDLSKKVDGGFARLDADIRALRGEMNARFDAMNDSINARFDAANRNLIGVVVAIVAAIIGSNAFF